MLISWINFYFPLHFHYCWLLYFQLNVYFTIALYFFVYVIECTRAASHFPASSK